MIEVDFDDVKSMLRGMIDTLEDPDTILEEVCGPILRESFERQFARGGFPDPWKPLAEITIQRKEYQGWPRRNRLGLIPGYTLQRGVFGPQNILIRTGSLRVSWTRQDHQYHVCESRNGVLTIGSSLPWSVFHQSTAPRKKLPRRPLVITDDDISGCAMAVAFFVVNGSSPLARTSRRRK